MLCKSLNSKGLGVISLCGGARTSVCSFKRAGRERRPNKPGMPFRWPVSLWKRRPCAWVCRSQTAWFCGFDCFSSGPIRRRNSLSRASIGNGVALWEIKPRGVLSKGAVAPLIWAGCAPRGLGVPGRFPTSGLRVRETDFFQGVCRYPAPSLIG